jgi:aspartate aminotransferase
MPVKVAAHIAAIPASPTLSLSAKVKELQVGGKDVIDLSAGEPDFPLPKVFADGITNALNKGQTTYPPVPGIIKLREAVAADLSARHGVAYTAEQIVVGTGAKQPLALAFQIVLGEGDEAIVPTPFWVSYADQVRLCRANPVLVTCGADTNYKLTPQKLRAAITPKTKAIILGSPSNPTGAVYTADELKALGAVLKEFPDMLIIADQIYDQLIYDGQKAPSIVGVMPELAAQTIIIDGMSKAYAATGLRLGWAAGPANLIKTIATVQGHMTSGACSIIQHGALAMLQAPDRAQQIATMVSAYQKRRDTLMAKLQAEPRLKIFKPAGAFYLWCNIEAFGMADSEFCNLMLEKNGVAAVPGSAFGSPGHIRIHFAAGDATLAQAAERILTFCGGLK